jgi:hypothetical protein
VLWKRACLVHRESSDSDTRRRPRRDSSPKRKTRSHGDYPINDDASVTHILQVVFKNDFYINMLWRYRKQPAKGIYLTIQNLVTLFVRIPIWSLIGLTSLGRQSSNWSFQRSLYVRLVRHVMDLMYMSVHCGIRITPLFTIFQSRPIEVNARLYQDSWRTRCGS